MPIDDILDEKTNGALSAAEREMANQQSGGGGGGSTRGNGTITLELPDPMNGDRDSLLFWMNVAELVVLIYIALRL
jgi:hypothetical protein